MKKHVNIFVIGGGINGCGIARDAAGRGYSVALCEMNDLASGTSSWSSKLIHGGLRYLEHYDFLLVRKALIEREVLWAMAPHIVHPMRFVLPYHKGLRPAWMLRIGLFLYDHLGGRKLLPPTKTVNLASGTYGRPLKSIFTKGFQYSDCQVDDARLTILNAVDAHEQGADILVRSQCVSATRDGKCWNIQVKSTLDGTIAEYTADLVVNAAGPWVDQVLNNTFDQAGAHNVRLVQGSHIVVPKLFEHDNSYIFQNADDRIIFAIPYTSDTTLIGTTDHDFVGDPSDAAITDHEIDYLCQAASEYFEKPIERSDIVWTFAGVRPLFDDGASAAQEATRDYIIKEDGAEEQAPLINIFGGKITTYRVLSETLMELAEARLGRKGRPWTQRSPLPGGDFPVQGLDQLVELFAGSYPFIDRSVLTRMVKTYGTRLSMVLGKAENWAQLGQDFGCGLTEAELWYLVRNEWAQTADDVIWRRTKLGLDLNEQQIVVIEDWMKNALQD